MNDIDWDALDRYFSGEASPRDAATLELADAKLLNSVRELWDAAGVISAPASPDVDEAWRLLSDRMTRDEAIVLRLHRASGSHGITWRSPRIWPGLLAASAAVAIAAVALNHVIDSREAAQRAAVPPPAPREFSTRSAQRAEVMLSDGTRVVLAPESKLTVPAQYDSLDRAVSLEGQAYFDVARNNGKPFIVRAR